jgi:predicted PurR-regulated permease PerM
MRQQTVQHAGFLFLLVGVTLAFGILIAGFVAPIFWAAVLAIVFQSLQRRMLALMPASPTWAATLTTVVIMLVVFVPVGFIAVAVSREAVGLYGRVQSGEVDVSGAFDRWLPAVVRLGAPFGITPATIRGNVADATGVIAQYLASKTLSFGQNAVSGIGQVGITLYLLFFFIRDGDRILDAISRALPLGDARERALFARFTSVTRATLKGTLVVGIVQGTLGGLLFALVGIGAPAFWGVLMAAVSLVPLVGSTVIWLPAAIILMLTGSVAKGLFLLGGGVFLIGLADNILRPILVGRETSMPDYVVLIATLGGIGLFGLSGFVAGPVIAALFITVWEMFAREYAGADRLRRPRATPAE